MNLSERIESISPPIWTPRGELTSPPAILAGLPPYSIAAQHVAPQAANSNLPNVIALTGEAGTGKSTVAGILADYGYDLVKFAGPLKSMIAALGFSYEQIEGDKAAYHDKLNGNTLRHAMQTLGTEWGRKCMGEDFWINLWRHETMRHAGHIVVDDCRFPNEVSAVRELGGVIWRVTGRGGIAGSHASEAGVDDFDLEISNAVGVDSLRGEVAAALGLRN